MNGQVLFRVAWTLPADPFVGDTSGIVDVVLVTGSDLSFLRMSDNFSDGKARSIEQHVQRIGFLDHVVLLQDERPNDAPIV